MVKHWFSPNNLGGANGNVLMSMYIIDCRANHNLYKWGWYISRTHKNGFHFTFCRWPVYLSFHSRTWCVLRCFIINECMGGLGTFTSADIASHTPASKNASIVRLSITTARVWQTVFLSNHRLAQATREPPWGGAAYTEQGTEARQTVHFHIHDRVYVNILNAQCVALNNTGSLRWESLC